MTRRPDRHPSFKDWGQLGKHFVHDFSGKLFQPFAVPRLQIKNARLVATHNTLCPHSGLIKRDGKSGNTGEVAAAGDGQHHRQLRYLVKGFRRQN